MGSFNLIKLGAASFIQKKRRYLPVDSALKDANSCHLRIRKEIRIFWVTCDVRVTESYRCDRAPWQCCLSMSNEVPSRNERNG